MNKGIPKQRGVKRRWVRFFLTILYNGGASYTREKQKGSK